MKSFLVIVGVLAFANAGTFVENKLRAEVGQNCDPSLNIYHINKATADPWPPAKNEDIKISGTGTINQDVTFASLEVFAKYQGFDFDHKSVPQSGSYKVGDTAVISTTLNVPSISPPGHYSVQLKVKDTAGNYLNCWEVQFDL